MAATQNRHYIPSQKGIYFFGSQAKWPDNVAAVVVKRNPGTTLKANAKVMTLNANAKVIGSQ